MTDNKNEEGKIKIRKGNNFTIVSAKAFLDCYEIPHRETKKFEIIKSRLSQDKRDKSWLLSLS